MGNCFHPPSRKMRTLLHVAVEIADLLPPPSGLNVIEVLLQRGANVTLPNGGGDLPLSMAVRADRADIVGTLLTWMPPGGIDEQDGFGRTALMEAARVGARNCAARLAVGGASTDLRD